MVERSLVYIYSGKSPQRFVGCGALVEGGYVVTCRHVWDFAAQEPNSQNHDGRQRVAIVYPRSREETGETKRTWAELADSCEGGAGPRTDLVILRPNILPIEVTLLQLPALERFEIGDGYAIAGIVGRDKTRPNVPRDGRVQGTISDHVDASGLRQFTGFNQAGYWFSSGSSGSPIFLDRGMQLAGILSLSELGANDGDRQLREAFVVPGTTIRSHLIRLAAAPAAVAERIDLADLRSVLEAIGADDVSVAEVPGRLRQFVETARAHAAQPVRPSNQGNDVEAVIEASRRKLGQLDPAGARAILQTKIDDEEASLKLRLLPLLKERAAIERMSFDHEAAKSTLIQVTDLDPDDTWAWFDLGDLYMRTGPLENAATSYRNGEDAARRIGSESDLCASFNRIGGVLRAQGKLDQALGRYRDGLTVAQRLAASDPSNTQCQRDLLVSLIKVGDALGVEGKLVEALGCYRAGLAVAEGLAESDPSNTLWQRDVAVSFSKIGDVQRAQGKQDEALARYCDGLAVVERLAASDPSNTQWQRDVSVYFDWIGDLLRTEDKLDEAFDRYSDGLAVAERLAASDPSNTEWQRDLSVSFSKIGDMLKARGKLDEAFDRYSDGLAVAERLAASDPSNTESQRDLFVGVSKIGDVLQAQGKPDEALGRYRDGLTVVERLAASDPSNKQLQRDVSVSLSALSDLLLKQGKPNDARTYRERDLAVARRLVATDPSNAVWQVDLAISCVAMARINPDGAVELRNEAEHLLSELERTGRLPSNGRAILQRLRKS